ncbi:hypothetical protein FV232_24440 [Methylobacterium sp. WL30]|uniref:hypothetical protein n=1 Tax=unclassified Methylobacterium TaxID=2615210 RepID=UPI0011C94EB2|nr:MULTISPECIES: hypothetical protein [unclassified Methylobacterium]TXN40554.1 hypothetical protein FV225_05845 [Methylobacterium sp. WL93]TXN49637.1 hypothetical protein FV227_15505 [Methylobacterium sp. WL119]TXN62913.1 hypothetical protein FV232_24440 [Methylobacterium sp. WL30]
MNKAFGVQVTVTPPGAQEAKTAPVIVVAKDDQDAALVAAEAAGEGAQADTLRELTEEEVMEHDLDLSEHGIVKALSILNL